MRIGVFVNDLATEKPEYTTTRLGMAATARGHEIWYIGAEDFACDPDGSVRARAGRPAAGASDLEAFLAGAAQGERERISVDDLDALLLRNDPADDVPDRRWAQNVGVLFGGLAARRGVVVLNDPAGLSVALTKLYLQHFPPEVRPATLVTRDPGEVRAFVGHHGGRAVLKPLQGSGGQGVFLVQPDDDVNLDQMVEALARDGYLVAQEYAPAAAQGDTRLFLLDGQPLQSDGTYAAFRRIPAAGEARSNMRTGATVEPAEVDATVLRLAEKVGPRLANDGMFLVGLDIAGDHLLEVNVFSPGGLRSVQSTTGTDFAPVIVEAVEGKARGAGMTGDGERWRGLSRT